MSPRDPNAHLRPDPDFRRARRALSRGWVTREQIERAILREEEHPGSNLLSFLPLSPEQISTLDHDLPARVAKAMTDPSRGRGRYWIVDLLRNEPARRVYRGWDLERRCWVILESPKEPECERPCGGKGRERATAIIPPRTPRIGSYPGPLVPRLRKSIDRVLGKGTA